jgi:hypothetical protein
VRLYFDIFYETMAVIAFPLLFLLLHMAKDNEGKFSSSLFHPVAVHHAIHDRATTTQWLLLKRKLKNVRKTFLNANNNKFSSNCNWRA